MEVTPWRFESSHPHSDKSPAPAGLFRRGAGATRATETRARAQLGPISLTAVCTITLQGYEPSRRRALRVPHRTPGRRPPSVTRGRMRSTRPSSTSEISTNASSGGTRSRERSRPGRARRTTACGTSGTAPQSPGRSDESRAGRPRTPMPGRRLRQGGRPAPEGASRQALLLAAVRKARVRRDAFPGHQERSEA